MNGIDLFNVFLMTERRVDAGTGFAVKASYKTQVTRFKK